MTWRIMVQGGTRSAGVSLAAAGLCRNLRRRGLRAAPFRSVCDVVGSAVVTADGGEVSPVQAVQAEACGAPPSALMNPVLIRGDRIFVNDPERGRIEASASFLCPENILAAARKSYAALSERVDAIVVEGSGNPTDGDVANMPTAEMTGAPVLLIVDGERGGASAAATGTMALLSREDRERVCAVLVNRGPGGGVGVIPRLEGMASLFGSGAAERPLDVAVARLAGARDFRDAAALCRHPAYSLRFVERVEEVGAPDLLLLPYGGEVDEAWLALGSVPVVCSGVGSVPMKGVVGTPTGIFSCLAGVEFSGETALDADAKGANFAVAETADGRSGVGVVDGNILSTGMGGFFESGRAADLMAEELLRRKGVDRPQVFGGYGCNPDSVYDTIADALGAAIDVDALFGFSA